jgi:hypothetical protein
LDCTGIDLSSPVYRPTARSRLAEHPDRRPIGRDQHILDYREPLPDDVAGTVSQFLAVVRIETAEALAGVDEDGSRPAPRVRPSQGGTAGTTSRAWTGLWPSVTRLLWRVKERL